MTRTPLSQTAPLLVLLRTIGAGTEESSWLLGRHRHEGNKSGRINSLAAQSSVCFGGAMLTAPEPGPGGGGGTTTFSVYSAGMVRLKDG